MNGTRNARAVRRTATVAGATLLVLGAGGGAFAYYTAATTSSDTTRYPAVRAGGLGPVTGLRATGGTGKVDLAWDAVPGITTGYRLLRYSALTGGTGTAVCSAALTSTATSCTDTVGTGTYYYSATARYSSTGMATAWTGAESARVMGVSATSLGAPSTPVLAAGSDTGSSSTDRITNLTNPTFSGTGVVGATVTVYDGATVLGTTAALTTTSWSFTVPGDKALSVQGTHIIAATQTLAGVTSAPSGELPITLDTVRPTGSVTIGAPVVASNSQTAVVSGTMTGDVTALTLGITCASGTPLASTPTYPTATTWTSNLSGLVNKSGCTLTGTGTDTAGNATTAAPVTKTFTP